MYKTYEELGNNPRNKPPVDQFQVLELQNIDHRDHIVNSNRVVVIDIYADWCGPCKMTAPEYSTMASKYNKAGECMLVKYKLDNMHQSEKGAVNGIPLFNFYVMGRLVDQVVGGNLGEVETKLKSILGQQGSNQPVANSQQFDNNMGPNANRNSIRNSRMDMPSNEYGTGQPYMSGGGNYHQPYAGSR